jgi:hypothetical protein
MKKIIFVAILFATLFSYAQVGVGTTNPDNSSVLDVTSTTKGFLLPRMTNAQKNNIVSPAAGLWIWCTDCGTTGEMQVFNGLTWTALANDIPPSALTYIGSPYIFTKGMPISPIATPTYSGVSVVSFSVNPALPNGLVLNTSTGEITGTPTVVTSATNYTVTATNPFGSTTATINITVNQLALDKLGLTASSPASFAYSIRKLSTSYVGNAIIVRRSTDNTTLAIGFDGTGNLDETALLNFTTNNGTSPSADAFVMSWLDQSGNNNHVTQTDITRQPQIVSNGIVIKENNKPSIRSIVGSGNSLLSPSSNYIFSSYSVVGRSNSVPGIGGYQAFMQATGGVSAIRFYNDGTTPGSLQFISNGGISINTTTVQSPTNLTIYSSLFNQGNAYKNGSLIATSTISNPTSSTYQFRLFNNNSLGYTLDGTISEIVSFTNGLTTTQRETIELNQANYYSITIAPSNLTYVGSPFIYTKGNAITPIAAPTSTGGTVVSYSVSPSLPSGLILNTSTGEITGTPLIASAATNYIISATNTGGSTTATISITVNEFLDNINSNYAFSLRKLRSLYTGPAIRVRRSSDNSEQDISFDASGNLNQTALLSFVGANDGFVVTWYDQSGNGNHAVAPATVNQPQIVISGAVYKQNNMPAIKSIFIAGNSNSSRLTFLPTATFTTNQFSLVGQSITAGNYSLFLQQAGPSSYLRLNPTDNLEAWTNGANVITSSTSQASSVLKVFSALFSTGILYANGSPIGSSSAGTLSTTSSTIALFNGPSGTLPLNGSISELISFPASVSTSFLESNQSLYYSINVPPTNLTYAGSPFTYSSVTGITAPTNSGSTPTSYSITPALPSGLTFNTATGAITGTQTVVSSAVTYTVTATNSSGSTSTTISITVSAIPPSALAYAGSPFTYTKGTAITPIAAPTYSGGAPTSYSISPALPTGLVLNTTTGSISGTPTVGSFATIYTISAINSGGSTSTTINITVNDIAPSALAYTGSPFSFTNGTLISPIASPTNSGGTPINYSISPALPSGLVFNTSTGAISGTPTVVSSAVTYLITGTNTGGSASTTISISVNETAPLSITYSGSPFVYIKNTAITPIAAPTHTGGTPTSYSVSPLLPTGLSLNTTTGSITGTPTVVVSSTSYTITAANSSGNTTASINITVNDIAPTALVYVGSPYTFYTNTAITPIAAPTNSGGTPTNYSVSPSLPSGLILNTSTGAITGTPTVVSALTNYTITASNTSGSTTAIIKITVTPAEALDLIGLTSSDPRTSAAFSLRKLRSNYSGNAVLVRRSTDNTTQAIGFDGSGNLDVSALVNFTTNNGANPSANAFVVTWYDQSGVNNHVTNAIVAKQPQIVSNGSVITRSGKPVVYLPTGASAYLQNSSAPVGLPNTMVNIAGIDQLSGSNIVMSGVGTGNGNIIRVNNGGGIQGVKIGQALVTTNNFITSPMVLNSVTMIQPATAATTIYFNGSAASITGGATAGISTPASTVIIGAPGDFGDNSSQSFISESLFFPSELSSTIRGTIETNQFAFYMSPLISYNASNNFSIGVSNSISPVVSGGPISSYTISPSLPSGLSINTTTGVISGTPLAVSNATTYTVTATNMVGSTTATFDISVFDFTLDKIGLLSTDAKASAAYSLRKLRTSYTGNAILVRRSSDNTTQAIGFDGSDNLNETALINFTTNNGANLSANAYVVTWYDQSGFDKHATNATESKQPLIVSNGLVLKRSGKPVVYFGQDAGHFLKNSAAIVGVPNSMVNVGGIDNLFYASLVMSHVGGSNGNAIYISNGSNIIATKVGVVNIGTSSYAAEKVLNIVSMIQPTGTNATSIFLNNSSSTITSGATASIATPSAGITIGARGDNGAFSGNSFISESIIFPTELSIANRNTIETNEFTYFMSPSISYPSTNNLSLGTSNLISPTLLGGPIASYSISPALSSGLTFNTTTGQISGSPTAVIPDATYTVTATNLVGSTTSTFTISIIDNTLDNLGFTNSDTKATVAYSLRKLRSDYSGNAILVRRSSDNVTQAIGFDVSGSLDQSALTSFIGANSGYVVTWYDQSGFNNHVTQSNLSSQPRIVNAGTIETFNGKPAVYFNGSFMSGNSSAFPYPNTINGVVGTTSSTATGTMLAIGENNGPGFGLGNYLSTSSTNYNIAGIKGSVNYVSTNTTMPINTTAIMTMNTLTGGLATTLKLNGTALTITGGATDVPVTASAVVNIGSNSSTPGSTELFSSYIQEGVFFSTSLSSTLLQTLENNQSVYYGAVPANLTYSGSPYIFISNSLITPIAAPTNTGGAVTNYSVSPALPAGLTLNAATGAITGTPTSTSASTTYTVTATNGFGNTQTTINITVN